jgi:hypothetical protein
MTNYTYSPYEDTLRITRLLYAAVVLLFLAALAYASGALVIFEDGSMILTVGDLTLSGCPNPLALCAR